ncbi:MAG: ABC transporter substrate-binding protein [Acidobacteria bacterium]|nr:ABC transporter substrate-binding protein [Acidobacteriota bacterium]MBV9478276.1 ABC transporter substrate-binding protein [Acidobacteriota bacterium]
MIRDIRGVPLALDAPPRRVVSLVPSITETLFDLGAGDDVVAITDFCIFPPALALPRVGGTKNPRVDEIRALAPDLVHMNLEENLKRHGDAIEAFAPVFVSEPKSVDDVAELLAQLGAIHGRGERADALVRELRDAESALPSRAFTFAVPIWKQPWMWCGGDTYVSQLVTRAGGRNILGDRTRYPQLSLEDVLALRPDVVFLPDEPYLFTGDDARAIRGPRVIGPFPGHLFTWHGTRTTLGLRFLAEALA